MTAGHAFETGLTAEAGSRGAEEANADTRGLLLRARQEFSRHKQGSRDTIVIAR